MIYLDTLLDATGEIFPGIFVHRADGHSRGQQWIEVRGKDNVLFFPTDLMPTSHHASVPFHMGYDACAETVMKEKETFARRALAEEAIVVFQHDPLIPAGKIVLDERGNYSVKAIDGNALEAFSEVSS